MARSMVAPKTEEGARIREKRILLKLSQKKLAELAGVSMNSVINFERGTHNSKRMELLLDNALSTYAQNAQAINNALLTYVQNVATEPNPFGCRDEILRFFVALEDLIRAMKKSATLNDVKSEGEEV